MAEKIQKIGVACDNYKVPLFREELTTAGIDFKIGPGVTADVKTITCKSTQAKVAAVVAKVNARLLNNASKNN